MSVCVCIWGIHFFCVIKSAAENMDETVDSELLSQPIAKQKKKPKKKSKTTSSEQTVEENVDASQAHRDSDEVLHKLTECLRIGGCNSLVNGDSEKHNNNLSCARKAKSCTEERNSCCNQSDINFDESNLGNEQNAEPTLCNSISKCNGTVHSPSDGTPSTSFASSQIDTKSSTEIPAAVTIPSDNVAHNPIGPEQQDIVYKVYENELQMPDIMRLIQKDLSEPYSIYTYRYFIHNWPKLCFLAMYETTCVGAIVCKLDIHRQQSKRGYIAMLAVDKDYRKLKIGTNLVAKAIQVSVAKHWNVSINKKPSIPGFSLCAMHSIGVSVDRLRCFFSFFFASPPPPPGTVLSSTFLRTTFL